MAEAIQPPRERSEWWVRVTLSLILLECALYLLPQIRPGAAGLVAWMLGSDQLLWWGVVTLIAVWGLIRSARRRPFWNHRRLVGYAALVVLAAFPSAFRVYPSSYDQSPSQVRFRLPLDGPITVGWGGGTPDVNYHVAAPDQRWAYDLLVTSDEKSHQGDGEELSDYYAYGLPVLAPADGVVHAVSDGAAEMPAGQMGAWTNPGGNQLVIEVAPREFLFLCHLQPGSISVQAGDMVTTGQILGRVGNSGHTSEPHLHIHLQDTPEDGFGEGIPLYFHGYRAGDRWVERGIPTGGFRDAQFAGQIVEHTPRDDVAE